MKNRKGILILCLSMSTLLGLSACGENKPSTVDIEEQNSSVNTSVLSETEGEKSPEDKDKQEEVSVEEVSVKEETEKSEENLFKDLAEYDFWFASGAGGWSTELRIYEDGIFMGVYHDNDIGDTGEGYPDGTRYLSSFSGRFTKPEKVNDYTYKTKIEYIKYDEEISKEEIMDGLRYIYTDAYGLDNAEDLYIYLPGTPINTLPEGYLSWVEMTIELKETEEELPFYGLYNEAEEEGFSSYIGDRSGIDEEIDRIEYEVVRMMEGFETMSQQEMNRVCEAVYILWDDELNSMWKRIKEKLDEEEMEQLTKEQREWIAYKEEKVKATGAEFEGGSAQPMVEYDAAAEITMKRVYELKQYLY